MLTEICPVCLERLAAMKSCRDNTNPKITVHGAFSFSTRPVDSSFKVHEAQESPFTSFFPTACSYLFVYFEAFVIEEWH